MLSLKLVRSLVLRETIHDPLHLNLQKLHQIDKSTDSEEDEEEEEEEEVEVAPVRRHRHHPCLIFLPTHEIIHETYKLAMIARDMGINFSPDPSLSAIIFSCPSHPNKPLISLPFPSLSSASIPHLRRFIRISKGLFKLSCQSPAPHGHAQHSTRSLSLFSRVTRNRVEDIDAFSRVLTSSGWTLYKANNKSNGDFDVGCYYVFRKVEANRRVRAGWWRSKGAAVNGDFGRVRELRLPALDFRNAPLTVLHYVLLMTDDLFYLSLN